METSPGKFHLVESTDSVLSYIFRCSRGCIQTGPTEKKLEEAKRDNAWDPKDRWLALQRIITWAESQLPEEKRAIDLAHHAT